MNPLLQTKFGKEGNCLCACIASLLEIPIESVPNPKHDDWVEEINQWLIENHNIYILSVVLHKDSYLPSAFKNSITIGCGRSINNIMHAVLVYENRIIHDPLPNSGLTFEKIEEFDLLVKFFR
ncbi:MAG: hypothetical protein WC389_21060 [Lutibacter sp.]|jgi:hypothetical protein